MYQGEIYICVIPKCQTQYIENYFYIFYNLFFLHFW